MPLIQGNTVLCNLIVEDPTIVAVLYRFGITLGVGENTVHSMCVSHNIDETFFTTILNTYVSPEYFPERTLSSFQVSVIIDYLTKTNAYYEQYQIPNIERHFNFLLQKSVSNNNLDLMLKFFHEMKTELQHRIEDDRTRWFPQLLKCPPITTPPTPTANITIEDSQDSIEDKIDDLISMFVVHLKGDYNSNLCQAVLTALLSIKKDITQNNRIRNRILRPLSDVLLGQAWNK